MLPNIYTCSMYVGHICCVHMLGNVVCMLGNVLCMLGNTLGVLVTQHISTCCPTYRRVTQHITVFPNIYPCYPTYVHVLPNIYMMLSNIYTCYPKHRCYPTYMKSYMLGNMHICWGTCYPTYNRVTQHIYGSRNVPQYIHPAYIPNRLKSLYMLGDVLKSIGYICWVHFIYVG